MKKIILCLWFVFLTSQLMADDVSKTLIAVVSISGNTGNVLVINLGLKKVGIRSLVCSTVGSKSKTEDMSKISQNTWFEDPYIINPNEAVCVALVTADVGEIAIDADVDGNHISLPVANMNTAKAWMDLRK